MITNPKTFFEQFQNFIEESGLQLKKFKSSLSNYFTKSEAIGTFLGKTDQAESAKKADEAIKATQDSEGNVISSTYLKTNTASTTYLTQANASSTYLTKTGKATSASTADTAGSANTATKATQDAKGNVIDSTYLTKSDATSTYLTKNGKAASATSADTATKASPDSSGNEITTTYLKKADAESTYLGKTAKAESAKVADSATTAVSATKATQDGNGKNIAQTYVKTVNNVAPVNGNVQIELPNNEGLIPKTGDRGALAGYAQVAYSGDFIEGTSVYVDEHFPDSVLATKSYDIFLDSPEEFGRSWTKVIVCDAVPSSIKMSAKWMWTGEATPTLEGPGYLVCHWAGMIGVATYVHTYEYVNPELPV